MQNLTFVQVPAPERREPACAIGMPIMNTTRVRAVTSKAAMTMPLFSTRLACIDTSRISPLKEKY